jgi:methylglutaconyl-CoA hydratase
MTGILNKKSHTNKGRSFVLNAKFRHLAIKQLIKVNIMAGFVNTITSEIKNTTIIEFYHPKGNSLPSDLLDQLEQAIYNAGDDNKIKAILIRSVGDKVFCAGASFDELVSIDNEETGEKFFNGFARVINAIRKVPKFVIGEVQGKAVGGGVGLACAFDYCFATENASVKLSELSIGIGPFVIAPAVERKIGVSGLAKLSINAKNWKTAEWAKQKGMFADVYNSKEEMQIKSEELLNNISEYSLESVSEMKKILWKDCENWDELLNENAKISGRLVLSDFTKSKLKDLTK